MTEKNNPRSLVMLLASMLIFGTIGIFRRCIPLPSALIAFIRGAVGALFLTAFVLLRGKKLRHGIGAKRVIQLAVSGALMGLNWILLFEAYNYTSVATATLCYYMEPVFVILGSAVLFREKITARKGLCTLTALVGMVFVSGVIGGGIPQASELKGMVFGLSAAVLYTCVVLMNRVTAGVDAYEKSVIQLASAAIVLIPYLLLTLDFSQYTISVPVILLLAVVGIVHTGICYALYFGAMDGLKMQTIALFSYIDPLTALILSAVLLREGMTLFGIIGAVLILGSAVVGELGKN